MVVVNDGLHFTTTDEQGRWTLTSDTCQSKFVAISTPADYELNNDHGLARFYIPMTKAMKSDNNDFVLCKRKCAASATWNGTPRDCWTIAVHCLLTEKHR